MPRKPRSNSKNQSDIKEPSLRSRWLWAGLCFLLAALFAISFFDYEPAQNPDNFSPDSVNVQPNAIGLFGVRASIYGFYLLGGSAWLIPTLLAWRAWLFLRKVRQGAWTIVIAMLFCVISASGLLAIQRLIFLDREIYATGPGGSLGELLFSRLLQTYIGDIGSTLILSAIYIACVALVVAPAFSSSIENAESGFQGWLERWRSAREEKREAKRMAKLAIQEQKERIKEQRAEAKRLAREEKEAAKALVAEGKAASKGRRVKMKPEIDPEPEEEEEAPLPPKRKRASKPKPEPEPIEEAEPAKKPKLKDVLKFVNPEQTKKARVKLPEAHGDYIFPKLDLLAPQATPNRSNSEEEHTGNAERLQKTLKEFGVEVSMGEIHIGPVITRYEVYPAPGVRVEKISNLDKNIALGMRAQSVRILAPVPGKGCVGIEVPNQDPTPVGIREIQNLITEQKIEIHKNEIQLPNGPIREAGEHQIQIKLTAELSVDINLEIIAKQQTTALEETIDG